MSPRARLGRPRRRSTAVAPLPARSRLRAGDVFGLATAGLRARPTRAVLSALGIAIGIAAMIAVVGTSAASQERLNSQLAELGTNLLTIEAGSTAGGGTVPLPADASARVQRIPGVTGAAATGTVDGASVYRNRAVDPAQSGGITVQAAEAGLLGVVGAELAAGEWLNAATGRFPAAVLGHLAAERLGVTEPGGLIWLAGQNATVLGVLEPVGLAPELDSAALVGVPFATEHLEYPGTPSSVYERSEEADVLSVRSLIGPSLQPEQPGAVAVSRPSDALAAQAAVGETFTLLLLALGSIALLVGGIGVANTMVISVLERRREIGLRRALGATRRHIRLQFLAEALLLSALGGLAGVVLGSGVSAVIALANGWTPVLPGLALAGGAAATVVIGGLAGLAPAMRAARTPPTVALTG